MAIEKVAFELSPHMTNVQIAVRNVSDSQGFTSQATNLLRGGQPSPQAVQFFRKAIKDNSLSREDKAWAHYNLALGLYLTGDYGGCLGALANVRGISDQWIGKLKARCRAAK